MENNDFLSPSFANNKNISGENQMNLNQNVNNNPINIDKNMNEKDENDNLAYLPETNTNNYNNTNNPQSRLNSIDSPLQAQFKYSIDIPNVSKQRLHEFLNEDLLNALDVSPNIPKLSSDLQNIKNDNSNNSNNPNSLYGFSLYSQNPVNVENVSDNNNNSQNIGYIPAPNYYPKNYFNQKGNQNNASNNNFSNVYNNNINFNNYNYNFNFPEMPNYNNNILNNLNSNNPPIFIPKQMRNKDSNQKGNILNNDTNIKFNNNEKTNVKNKFDNNKKNAQNNRKDGRNKKPFEVRIGDWNCSQCNNLNFSFRNKCNRCGIPKEMSEKLAEQLINQEMMAKDMNINFQKFGNH